MTITDRTKTRHNQAMQKLNDFVGSWNGGQTTFEWLDDRDLLLLRQKAPGPDVPSAVWVIGVDDQAPDTYSMLYSDSRGISRIYQMSFDDHSWKIWRQAPGFSQRFTASLSSDGRQMKGAWETSPDEVNWQHDFDLTYTRDL